MLAKFQQALADLVASPELCRAIRDVDGEEATSLLDGYDLSPTERPRLVAIVRHRDMAANCTVYRSNRLTPIVINLPETCDALGGHFRAVVDQFWASHPTAYFVHFRRERPLRHVRRQPATGHIAGRGRATRQRCRAPQGDGAHAARGDVTM